MRAVGHVAPSGQRTGAELAAAATAGPPPRGRDACGASHRDSAADGGRCHTRHVAVYDALTPPPPVPELAPPARGLTALKAPDPTTDILLPDARTSLAAETNARAAIRTDGDPSGNRYARGLAASTVGQVASSQEACTATMIESRSGRVATTAAHCVYWPAGHPEYNPLRSPRISGWTNLNTYVPGRSGDRFPYGKWVVEGAWVHPIWQRTADPRYDVAFLRLGTRDGETPQHALGAQGVAFDSRPTAAVTVLGYPANPPFDGTALRRCTTPATTTNPRTQTIELRCQLKQGSSGGPWLSSFDPTTGRGKVMAVSGYTVLDRPILGAVRLGAMAQQLYLAADTNTPHR